MPSNRKTGGRALVAVVDERLAREHAVVAGVDEDLERERLGPLGVEHERLVGGHDAVADGRERDLAHAPGGRAAHVEQIQPSEPPLPGLASRRICASERRTPTLAAAFAQACSGATPARPERLVGGQGGGDRGDAPRAAVAADAEGDEPAAARFDAVEGLLEADRVAGATRELRVVVQLEALDRGEPEQRPVVRQPRARGVDRRVSRDARVDIATRPDQRRRRPEAVPGHLAAGRLGQRALLGGRRDRTDANVEVARPGPAVVAGVSLRPRRRWDNRHRHECDRHCTSRHDPAPSAAAPPGGRSRNSS